jgi:hypothetical protein
VKEVAIYVEGGGDSASQKAQLRIGFDGLLSPQKQNAQLKNLRWKLVPSGSRNNAYEAFMHESQKADRSVLCVLLVDSEEGLAKETKGDSVANAQVRKLHLTNRDGWDLRKINPEQIHLMVQCMEAWIVADPEALAEYYGKGFHAKSLPDRVNLEEEPKTEVFGKLANATKRTSKGEYSQANNAKIKHASRLLALIRPAKVAKRCPRFSTFAKWLKNKIDDA